MEQLVLVFFHIVGGALWASFAVFQAFWLVPAVTEAGPGGGAVMGGIMKRKFVLFMNVVSWTSLLSGLRLYMIRFSTTWLTTAEGIVITLGMVLAIGAAVIGGARQRPLALKLAELGAKGPSPEIPVVQAKLAKTAKVTAFHLIGALVLMAAHRLAAVL